MKGVGFVFGFEGCYYQLGQWGFQIEKEVKEGVRKVVVQNFFGRGGEERG